MIKRRFSIIFSLVLAAAVFSAGSAQSAPKEKKKKMDLTENISLERQIISLLDKLLKDLKNRELTDELRTRVVETLRGQMVEAGKETSLVMENLEELVRSGYADYKKDEAFMKTYRELEGLLKQRQQKIRQIAEFLDKLIESKKPKS